MTLSLAVFMYVKQPSNIQFQDCELNFLHVEVMLTVSQKPIHLPRPRDTGSSEIMLFEDGTLKEHLLAFVNVSRTRIWISFQGSLCAVERDICFHG